MPESEPTRLIIHALVHATEDEEKVITAIRRLLSEAAGTALQIKRTRLRGHFHNPILRLVATLTQRSLIVQALKFLGQRLLALDRERLERNLDRHYDGKGQLFLRFDKQESYHGRLRLVERGDALRLVIKFPGRKLELKMLRDLCQQLGLL